MKSLLQFQIIVLLFILVRCADLCITSAIAKDIIRAIVYGIVGVLALIALVVGLLL